MRFWTCLGSAGLLVLASAGVFEAHAQAVDLLIRQARVIDGTGSPWFVSDVAIDDGRIVALGTNLDVEASQVIDAAGRILAPGFIDVHTHAEPPGRGWPGNIPRADNFLLDGVTTVVAGNCGGSETDIGEWSRGLTGLGINVATLVGHNSIRSAVMGLDDRPPTAPRTRTDAGAGRKGHVGRRRRLLDRPPVCTGTYADTDEVISLAKVAADYGGVYTSHIREQGAALHESIDEAVAVGREAGMPVQISHFKVKGRTRWGSIGDAIDLVEAHRASGVDVMIDVYPYERPARISA